MADPLVAQTFPHGKGPGGARYYSCQKILPPNWTVAMCSQTCCIDHLHVPTSCSRTTFLASLKETRSLDLAASHIKNLQNNGAKNHLSSPTTFSRGQFIRSGPLRSSKRHSQMSSLELKRWTGHLQHTMNICAIVKMRVHCIFSTANSPRR